MSPAPTRTRLAAAFVLAAVLGIGLVVLQRWVAETRGAAIALVSVWFAVVGVAALLAVRARPGLRVAVLGTYAAIALAAGAIGYWTGFRDSEVDEDVVTASAPADERERAGGLAAQDEASPSPPRSDASAGPVELVRGDFEGVDGHAGTGVASVIRDRDGARFLTFTEFDVDPGAEVEVWLTRDDSSTDDRVELGDLKGNVGDQQYEIPDAADLMAYDTVVLYCTPFTVRIAVAALA